MKTLQEYLGQEVNNELIKLAENFLLKNTDFWDPSHTSVIDSEDKTYRIIKYSDNFLTEFFSNTNPDYNRIQQLIT